MHDSYITVNTALNDLLWFFFSPALLAFTLPQGRVASKSKLMLAGLQCPN